MVSRASSSSTGFPLSLLQALSMHRSSIEFLVGKEAKNTWTESIVIVAHFVPCFGLLFTGLEPLLAVLFVAVHRGHFGVCMVSNFAPNHKAMPMLDKDSRMGFLPRQVLTSMYACSAPKTTPFVSQTCTLRTERAGSAPKPVCESPS